MIRIPENLLSLEEPFFACSRELLKEQAGKLAKLGAEVFYSAKTNPELEILKELQKLGLGFSVSSPDELLAVREVGTSPEKIFYYERGLNRMRAKWAERKGCVNFMADCETAFRNAMDISGRGSAVLARLKALPGGEYSRGYSPGMDPKTVGMLMDECKSREIKTGVLHHAGSQLEKAAVWGHKFEELSCFKDLDVINLGGGIPVPYDKGCDEEVLKEISEGIKGLDAERIIIEPGRFIVGPACSLVTKVALVDGNRAVLNASVYNTHIDTIIAGMLLPCRSLGAGEMKEYTLLGSSLCDLDVFAPKIVLPELREGDSVIFDYAGAYNISSGFGACGRVPGTETVKRKDMSQEIKTHIVD
jgi:diaminopimelate decarboxylase